jgi:hypothetical protein
MNIKEIEELMDDTKRLPRVSDKVALSTSLAALEIAKQLIILNENLAASGSAPKAKITAAGKKK